MADEKPIKKEVKEEMIADESTLVASQPQPEVTQSAAIDYSANKVETGAEQPASSAQVPAASPEKEVDECSICCMDLFDTDRCIVSPCKHNFHQQCICRWLKVNGQCPLCRNDVKSLRQKNGKAVRKPRLEPLPPDHPMLDYIPPPNDEEFVNQPLSSPDFSDDPDFQPIEAPRRQPLRERRTRGLEAIAEEARELMISDLASMISGGVGAARRRNGRSAPVGAPSRHDPAIFGRARSMGLRGGIANSAPRMALEFDIDEDIRMLREGIERRERASLGPPPTRRRRVVRTIQSSSDEEEEEEEEVNRPAISPESTTVRRSSSESEEEEETDSDSEEEDETESDTADSELSDEQIMLDEPGPSWRVMAPVTRRRKTTKKKSTKRRKKTTKRNGDGTITKTTRKRTKRTKKKGTKRRREGEEASAPRNRVRDVIPSLSFNGAGIEPYVSDEDDGPFVVRRRAVTPPRPTAASDPTDLLGQIMEDQTLALAPGRHVRQEGGRFVPADSFNRYMEKKEAKRSRQTSSSLSAAAVASSRTTPSPPQATSQAATAAPAASTATNTAYHEFLRDRTQVSGRSPVPRHENYTSVSRPIISSFSSESSRSFAPHEPTFPSYIPAPIDPASFPQPARTSHLSWSSHSVAAPAVPATSASSSLSFPQPARTSHLSWSSHSVAAPAAPATSASSSRSSSRPLVSSSPIDSTRPPSVPDLIVPVPSRPRVPITIGRPRHHLLGSSSPSTVVPSSSLIPSMSSQSFSTPLPPVFRRPSDPDRRSSATTGFESRMDRRERDRPSTSRIACNGSPSEIESKPVKKEDSEEEVICVQMDGPVGANKKRHEVNVTGLSTAEQKKQFRQNRLHALSSYTDPILLKAYNDKKISEDETRDLMMQVLRSFPSGVIRPDAVREKAKTVLRECLIKYVDDL